MMKLLYLVIGGLFIFMHTVDCRLPDDTDIRKGDKGGIGIDWSEIENENNNHTEEENRLFGARTPEAGWGDAPNNVDQLLNQKSFPYRPQLLWCLRKPNPRLRRCRCFFMWLIFCWGRPIHLQHPLCPCYYWCRWWP